MNPKLEEKIYNAGQKIGLTFDEREALRARLLSSIAKSERDVLSPYSPLFYWRQVSMYIKPQYVSIALIAVLVIGGVSAAAENALPGEPLYQVKTSVNENVLALFAFTPQLKAQLHTELAVRRLQEVEQLAISGKLDATTTAQAETKIDANLAVIKDSVKQLQNDNNATSAAVTSSAAESTLKVHEAILGTLIDGNATVNNAVQDLATNVGIQATALSLDRAGVDSQNSTSTLSIDVLLNQQQVTQDAIAFVQAEILASSTATTSANLEVATSSVDISTSTATSTATSTVENTATAKVQTALQTASDLLAQGSKKLDTKDYGDAFILFKKAQDTAISARLILEGKDAVPTSTATSTATSTDTQN